MSRPTGRRRRRQAANPHPHACVCCDIVQIRPQTQPQTPISQHSAQHTNQINPFHHPPTLQKCSTLLGAFSPIFGPMQTPTTRYRNTELRHSREPGDARPERVWSDAGPDATRLSGAGRGALGFRRRKARNSGYINQNHINANSDPHPTVTTSEAGKNAGQQEITRGGGIILSPQCYI